MSPRGGPRPGSGRPRAREVRAPESVYLLKAERRAMVDALDPGETLSAFMVSAGLAEAGRRMRGE